MGWLKRVFFIGVLSLGSWHGLVACSSTASASDTLFRIGFTSTHISNPSPATINRIADAYKSALGGKVEIYVAPSFPALIDAQVTGRIEYAIYTANAYATAQLLCECLEPLVAPVSQSGIIGIRAILVGNPLSPKSQGLDRQRRIGFVFLDNRPWPSITLTQDEEIIDTSAGSDQLVQLEDIGQGLEYLDKNLIDGILLWVSTPEVDPKTPLSELGLPPALEGTGLDVELLWASEPLRYGPHAIRSDVNEDKKRVLRRFLMNLQQFNPVIYQLLEETRLGGFYRVSGKDYQLPIDAIKRSVLEVDDTDDKTP